MERLTDFEALFRSEMLKVCEAHPDPSHDILHVERVVVSAKKMASSLNARLEIVVPAAWLHDCVSISKTDPRRSQASRISADRAMKLLDQWSYPEEYHEPISHAIEAHSFSAGVEARTLEAKIVQDADRLDALGIIGSLRCFAYAGLSGRPFYNQEDPFCESRSPDDQRFTLDHFYVKLFKLVDKLHTPWAKEEGVRRVEQMKTLLGALRREIL